MPATPSLSPPLPRGTPANPAPAINNPPLNMIPVDTPLEKEDGLGARLERIESEVYVRDEKVVAIARNHR